MRSSWPPSGTETCGNVRVSSNLTKDFQSAIDFLIGFLGAEMESLAPGLGTLLPLIAMAGAAVAFVIRYYQSKREARVKEFLKLVGLLESGSFVSKRTALYLLRTFPEHKEFILRLLRNLMENFDGPPSVRSALKDEIERTCRFLDGV